MMEYMFHRTQLLLEQWQYDALRAASQREGRSISEIVRGILSEALEAKSESAGHWIREVAGSGTDSESSGRDHDRYLYGDRSSTASV